jgi:cell division protein FtsB
MQLFKTNQRLAAIIAGVVILIIVGGLAWGFGQQLMLAHQIQGEETQLEQEVATEQAKHDYLNEQLEYVQSDEYVEYWARTEARLTKLGEVAVVILTEAE